MADRVRTVLGAIVLLALMHLAVSFSRELAAEPPRAPALLSAEDGALDDIVVQFHRAGAERFLPVYRGIFRALRRETLVRVVVADAEDERIFEHARRGWGPGPHVRYIRTGRTITSWARDRFSVLASADGPLILAPPRPSEGYAARVHDWLVPWKVRDSIGARARIRTTSFRFDGGDLIADRDRLYVSRSLFGRNPGADPDLLLAQVRRTVGRDVIRIGSDSLSVPEHHVGMFVTPLGGGRVAYGDPDLALRALGAREGEEKTIDVAGPLELDLRRERLDEFRHVAASLRAHGLTPIPLPLLPAREPYVYLSYNNVVLDRRADGLHVLLPTYGVPLDRVAIDAWRRLGTRVIVHPIRVDSVFRYGGSIGCLVASIARA